MPKGRIQGSSRRSQRPYLDAQGLYRGAQGCIVVLKGRTVMHKGRIAVLSGRTVVYEGLTVELKGRTVMHEGLTVVLKGRTVVHKALNRFSHRFLFVLSITNKINMITEN